MDFDDNEAAPQHSYLSRRPNEVWLLAEYDLYKTSPGAAGLLSEQKRKLYPEAFIENFRLGTLRDLCVEALAKHGTQQVPKIVSEDARLLKVYYESLPVELHLNDCYLVEDMSYWRRVVLAKTSDMTLHLKKIDEVDWKSKGVSIKYVELVENCPANYWPEAEMARLAALVREHVKDLHIRHLKSLPETAFAQYVDSDSELDVSSESSEEENISSDEPDTDQPEELDEEAEDEQHAEEMGKKAKFHVTYAFEDDASSESASPSLNRERNSEELEGRDSQNVRRARHARNAARQQLRDKQAAKRAERDERRLQREMKRYPPSEQIRKKHKRKKKIRGVFDIEVLPEPDDGEDKVLDLRNKDKLLRRIRRFDYPSDYCHHIDLSFVGYFSNLVSFSLEFLGPQDYREYHKRHLKFSSDDMTRLGKGLRTLEQLKIFRLRNSRMDSGQLQIVARALKTIDSLEEIDLGYDQLADDCAVALNIMLSRRKMLKVLELEHNRLEATAVHAIAIALSQHEDGTLDYLGLAHNPLGDIAVRTLCRHLCGTLHVERLNISGIEVSKQVVGSDIGYLIRNHDRLQHVQMTAIPLDHSVGNQLVRAVETNRNIRSFDCRECDMGPQAEFEIEIILRRNKYISVYSHVGESRQSEKGICEELLGRKHAIVLKVEKDIQRQLKCVREYSRRPSSVAADEFQGTEQASEEDYDIWAAYSFKDKAAETIKSQSETMQSSKLTQGSFAYDANSFNLDQFREHVYKPGPEGRHYYLQQHRGL